MRENSLFTIRPYKDGGLWVFDDPAVGLVREPFVSGADTIIESFAQQVQDADSGFTMVFSASAFPGFDARFEWLRPEFDGNWYRLVEPVMDSAPEGWLCPALLKYFDTAPAELYVKFG